jgi:hypothetical protein
MSISNTDLEQYAELYRVIKLNTGETLLCTLVDESEKTVTFEYPIVVEFIKVMTDKGLDYRLSTMTYCPFTEDRTFTVPSEDIQHINNLSTEMVRSYVNMVFPSETTEPTNESHTIH